VSAPRGVGLILVVVVVGLVVGSLLGELLGSLFREGRIQEVLTRGPTIGLTTPATLDFRFLTLTFGAALKVNLVGLLGIVVAAVVLRRL
jgi:uncharacterized protein DUF4321